MGLGVARPPLFYPVIKEYILEEIDSLKQQRSHFYAMANQAEGAIKAYEHLLARLNDAGDAKETAEN